MVIDDILKETESKMKKALEAARREFAPIRTGSAQSSLVENISVDCYDTTMPLKQVAAISAPEARLVIIRPWDPSTLGPIEKAILASEVGLTPTNDGKLIRISVPHLTEERREELIKVVRRIAEDGRVSIRSIRRDAIETLKEKEKDGSVTVDQRFKSQDKAQALTDRYISEIDRILADKEREIREV